MNAIWYLPLIPSFKNLFVNPNDAKNLRWHIDDGKCYGLLCHLVDSLQWKKIGKNFLNFEMNKNI